VILRRPIRLGGPDAGDQAKITEWLTTTTPCHPKFGMGRSAVCNDFGNNIPYSDRSLIAADEEMRSRRGVGAKGLGTARIGEEIMFHLGRRFPPPLADARGGGLGWGLD
jgi:hypothetical protein